MPAPVSASSTPAGGSVLAGVARGGAFAAAGSALGAGFGLILTLVVTHALDQTSAGQYFSATAVFLVLQTFLAFGVGAGLVRFVPRFRSLERTQDIPTLLRVAVLPVIAAGAAASVALWFCADALAGRIGHGHSAALIPTFHVIALLFLPSTLEVAAVECTRAFGSVRRYVVLQQIGVPLLRPVLVGIGAALDLPLWAIIFLWIVPLLIALVLGSVAVRAAMRTILGPKWRSIEPVNRPSAIAREYWTFTAARGSAMVMDILLTWLDVILVASFVSPAKAAIYAAASRFITAGTLVLQALRLTIAADISSALALGLRDRVSEVYRTATQWVVLFSWPLYLMMALFATTVLRVLGDGYSDGATVTAILCVAMMINLTAGNVGTVLLMGGKSTWVLFDKTTCVVVNVGLNLALIPRYGITGAAIAWAVTIALDSALSFWQVRRGMSIGGSLSGVGLAALAATLCFGVVGGLGRLLLSDSIPGLLASGAVGAGLYAAVLVRLRGVLALDVLTGAMRRRSGSTGNEKVVA